MTVTGADGNPLLEMLGWEMGVLNDKDDNSQLKYNRQPEDKQFYQVGATFKSPDDEHYYGLGENQEGYLDHRGHKVECWADYQAVGGPSFCVPFLVTNKGYGLLWDNPSKTTIQPGFNEQTKWMSQVVLYRDRRDDRRDLCRLPPTDRGYADAAKRSLRLDPVQAAVFNPGRNACGRQRVSRASSADRHAGAGLVLLHQDGSDGFHQRAVARSGGYESPTPCHEH
jgi:hypothetical protein